MLQALILLLFLAGPAWAATVTDDTVTLILCADGTYTSGSCDVRVDADGGQVRYIGAGGNNASNGLTHATRWLTLSKVDGTLPTGTNVALLNTTTFDRQVMRVIHAGTTADRSIIGSYKVSGAGVPVWTIDGVYGSGTTDQKAKILGHITQACIEAVNCDYRNTALVAAGLVDEWSSYIVLASSANYTTVQNIKIEGAGAQGMTNSGADFVIIDGVDVDMGQRSGILSSNNGDDVIIRNSFNSRLQQGFVQYLNGGAAGRALLEPGSRSAAGTFGQAIAVGYGTDRFLIENNTITMVAGEGIDAIQSRYGIIRGNLISNTMSTSIFPDGSSHVVIENNRLVGGGRMNANQTLSYWGGSIFWMKEYWQSNEYSPIYGVIRNNLIVKGGNNLYGGMGATGVTNGLRYWSVWYGNTTINEVPGGSSNRAIRFLAAGAPDSIIDKLSLKNNVSWGNLGSSACTYPTLSGVTTASHNHFLASQSDTDCNTSVSTGTPNLSLTPLSAWDAFDHDTFPTFANAAPTTGGVKDTCTPLTATEIDTSLFGGMPAAMTDVVSGAITVTNWAKENYYDANNTVRGATCSKGAVE